MKYITVFLIILISATACTAPEPAAEPVPVTRTTEPTTIPLPENTPFSEAAPTAEPPTATDAAASSTLIPQTFLWYIDAGDRRGNFYLVKMTADGQELWRTQFDQSSGIGLDPVDGGVWVAGSTPEFETALVKVNANGEIVQHVPGYAGPFAVNPNDSRVWTAIVNDEQLARVNPAGEEVARVDVGGRPYAIAVDPRDSSVWVAVSETRKLIKLNLAGQRIFTLDTPGFFSDSPQQIAINRNDGSIWHGGFENVYHLSSDGNILEQIFGFEAPIAVAVDPRDSSVWVIDFHHPSSGAVVKLDQNGNELFRVPLELRPTSLAVHPEDGSVWVGASGGLIKLSAEGFVQTTVSTVYTPDSLLMATVLAPPAIVNPSTQIPLNTPESPTPSPVTPTPIPADPPTAEICASVAGMLPDDCEALVQLLHQIDPNLPQTLVNEGCGWGRLSCDTDGRLTFLDLSEYNLDSLPPEIGNLTNLQQLILTNNNLETLPSEIGGLASLRYLELYGNKLTTLPPEVGQLTNLRNLSLNYNPVATLPPEIGQLANLEELNLWSVNLNSLPPEIGNMTNLKYLSLASDLESLPPEIGNLANLAALQLFATKLTTLPPEIGNLASLSRLDLGSNQLSSLPPEIGNLTNLSRLDLSHNNLTALPPQIGNLVNLEKLILAYNLWETLPPELGNLTNLEEFCLYPSTITLPPPVAALKEETICTTYQY